MLKLLLGVALVLLDLVSKHYLGSIHNYGASFGILAGWKWLFVALGLILLVIFSFSYKAYNDWRWKYGCMFIISGLIGNLIDRIILGYVRDFVAVGFWPVFNLADAYNCTGVVLILWFFFKK